MYTVYVLRNPAGLLYKGYTRDMSRRFQEHHDLHGAASYTRNRGPWQIVRTEEYETESEAKKREAFLKSGQGRAWLKKALKEAPQ
jgi:putative endonuclease